MRTNLVCKKTKKHCLTKTTKRTRLIEFQPVTPSIYENSK